MDNKIKSSIPVISLGILFFIGNTIINLPFSKSVNASIPGLILAFIITIPLILVWTKTIPVVFKNKEKNNLLFIISCLLFSLYAVFCGLVTFRNYITFSDKIILPEIGSFFPSIVFILVLYLLCLKKQQVLIKLSLISTVIILLFLIILFFAGIDNMSIKNLKLNEFPNISNISYQTLSYLSMSFLEGIVFIGFFKNSYKKNNISSLSVGFLVLLITLIQSLSVFGYSLLSTLNYPYASSMSILSFGDKFSRMEGFSYYLYFSCALIKTAVCLKSGKNALLLVTKKTEKFFYPVTLTVYGVFCIFIKVFKNLPFLTIAPFLAVPPIMLTVMFIVLYKTRASYS